MRPHPCVESVFRSLANNWHCNWSNPLWCQCNLEQCEANLIVRSPFLPLSLSLSLSVNGCIYSEINVFESVSNSLYISLKHWQMATILILSLEFSFML